MEKTTKLLKLKAKWEENLDEVIKFWTENSIDKEYGGFYTSLDAKGILGFNA
jgi:mannose/cellobiose epimerase-like protein (N-acyl-D-glucosamine 2-epimerase family)